MEFRGHEIDLVVMNARSEAQPTEYAFTLRDSIHQFYSEATVHMYDGTGLMSEFRLFGEGAAVDLTFGLSDQAIILENHFVVNSHTLQKAATPGLLSGEIEAKLVHRYAQNQIIKSEAHEGEIHTVVDAIVAGEPFVEALVSSTGNRGMWYRPMLTQKDFLHEILRETATSPDSEDTPFFVFIDSGNRFHFVSYAEMFQSSPQAHIYQGPRTQDSIDANAAYEIYPFTPGLKSHRDYWHQRHYFIEPDSGEMVEEDSKITDYGMYTGPSMPFIGGQPAELTSYTYHGRERVLEARAENIKGRIASQRRDALFQDRFFVSIPFNPHLTSGRTIELETTYHGDVEYERGLYFTSKYLIEQSTHRWRGDLMEGATTLIVSRPSAQFPSDYLFGGETYQ